MKHLVVAPLSEDFEPPSPCKPDAPSDSATWSRSTDDSWTALDPPETLAVAPKLTWTQDHRELIERAYLEQRREFLDKGQRYQIVWPPEASLWSVGSAYWSEGELCSVHDEDYQRDCEECFGVE